MPCRKIYSYDSRTGTWTSYWRDDDDKSGTGYDSPVSEDDFNIIDDAEWEEVTE